MAITLYELLRERPNGIIQRFVSKVQRAGSAPPGLSRSQLADHIPSFLESIAHRLAPQAQAEVGASELGRVAAYEHGEHTWNLGYDLAELVREYGSLRQSIFELVSERGVVLTLGDIELLGHCLNEGIADAVTEYIRFRDEKHAAQRAELEFLAEAGELLASSLDYRSTLKRLTSLLVPRVADWCAVQLDGVSVDEMPIAHVDPSKVEVLRHIYRRYPLPKDSPHSSKTVLATRKPVLVTEVDPGLFEQAAQSPEHLALLRQLGARSWLIVPLSVQEHMFGTLILVQSESGRRFHEGDVTMATDLARRAAIAIDNARLFQLSQQERARVEAATRAKDEFVAMVSHELRTPLNAILGWLRLMRSGNLDEQKRAHALQVIERNADAQNQLVADLLDISRVMTGKIRVYPAQVDLANIVDIALEDMRLALDAKQIQVHTTLAREQSVLRGDGERLQQVVWNLLSNAVKFTPKGGRIDIRLRRVDSDLELTVEDTGAGIDSEFLPHVFETFRQSDSSATRVHGGLGIGLSITKHLVDLHGGQIEARSEGRDRGAAFIVRLPVSPLVSGTVGVSRVPAANAASLSARSATDLTGLGVLVVEDDPDARELIACVLESCGVQVRAAASAAAALEALAEWVPDVLISDIGMPDQDGYSLIRAIRTAGADSLEKLPAIALTAFAGNQDRTRALVAGFNLHLGKPVEPAVLVHAVAELAGRVSKSLTPGRAP